MKQKQMHARRVSYHKTFYEPHFHALNDDLPRELCLQLVHMILSFVSKIVVQPAHILGKNKFIRCFYIQLGYYLIKYENQCFNLI
jgi:hypothetical protein